MLPSKDTAAICPILVRAFDRDGACYTHFVTTGMFTANTSVCEQLRFGFISEKSTIQCSSAPSGHHNLT